MRPPAQPAVCLVRGHLKALVSQGLVERQGTRSRGPGRPEVVYGLSPDADSLFPRREAEVLRELASFLQETGRASVLDEFFDRFIEGRRTEALARVTGLEGRERLQEAARILSEQGFMALAVARTTSWRSTRPEGAARSAFSRS